MQSAATDHRIASPGARSPSVPRGWILTTLAICLASALLLMPTPGARAEDPAVDPAARAMLPSALQKSGLLQVGLEINHAPYQYRVDGQAEGIDADLIRAIAAKLGLKAEFAFVDFAAILPAVQSGRFDVGANFANTAARRKVVSFVNYLGFVDGLLIQKGNPHQVDVTNACGLRIAAGVGSFQYANATRMSVRCVKDGKPPITIVPMSPANAVNALRAGRVDADEIGIVTVIYEAGQPGNQDLEALTLPSALRAPTLGYITNNDRDGISLARAMAAGLNSMIASGEYATILGKWKVPEAAWLKTAFAN